jgi:hypothetical protein
VPLLLGLTLMLAPELAGCGRPYSGELDGGPSPDGVCTGIRPAGPDEWRARADGPRLLLQASDTLCSGGVVEELGAVQVAAAGDRFALAYLLKTEAQWQLSLTLVQADGQLLAGPVRVADIPPGEGQVPPRGQPLVAASDTEVLVLYSDPSGTSADALAVPVRRFDWQGVLQGQTRTPGANLVPDAIFHDEHGYALFAYDVSTADSTLVRVSSDGALEGERSSLGVTAWEVFAGRDEAGRSVYSVLSLGLRPDGTNGYLVTRVDATGAPVGPPVPISCGDEANSETPVGGVLAEGQAELVACTRPDQYGENIGLSVISALASPPVEHLVDGNIDDLTLPVLLGRSGGGAILVYARPPADPGAPGAAGSLVSQRVALGGQGSNQSQSPEVGGESVIATLSPDPPPGGDLSDDGDAILFAAAAGPSGIGVLFGSMKFVSTPDQVQHGRLLRLYFKVLPP